MSIDEYISNNLPFYHVTPRINLEHILKQGLKKKRYGICVVRSKEKAILNHIIQQIGIFDYKEYAVIRILPEEKGITANDICEDSVEEVTTKLHNYILKDCIPIEEKDIIYKDYVQNPSDDIIPDGEIVELTGYHQRKRPFLQDGLEDLLKEFS